MLLEDYPCPSHHSGPRRSHILEPQLTATPFDLEDQIWHCSTGGEGVSRGSYASNQRDRARRPSIFGVLRMPTPPWHDARILSGDQTG